MKVHSKESTQLIIYIIRKMARNHGIKISLGLLHCSKKFLRVYKFLVHFQKKYSMSSATSSSRNEPTTTLCDTCNRNQEMKMYQLRQFTPVIIFRYIKIVFKKVTKHYLYYIFFRWIPKMRIKNCKPTKTIWNELIGYAEFAKLKLDKFWASKILNWNRNFSLGSWPYLGKF